jgi:hypothetical protein
VKLWLRSRKLGPKLIEVAPVLNPLIDLEEPFSAFFLVGTPLIRALLERVKVSLDLKFSNCQLFKLEACFFLGF